MDSVLAVARSFGTSAAMFAALAHISAIAWHDRMFFVAIFACAAIAVLPQTPPRALVYEPDEDKRDC